jgi:hypothetical protein
MTSDPDRREVTRANWSPTKAIDKTGLANREMTD